MRRRVAALASLLLAFASPPAAVPAQSVRTVPIGTSIDWSYAEHPGPAAFRSGPVALDLRWEKGEEPGDLVEAVLTVRMPGYSAVEARGSVTFGSMPHRATVGQLDAQHLFVLFQNYTGGAHCCTLVQAIVPHDGALRVVDVGQYDGEPLEDLPADIDGDGRLDFVFVDNAFLYRFTGYAQSRAPPQIINLIDGEAVDVSARPGFRRLFEEDRTEARASCLQADGDQNGACAAFVASAARVGRFDEAWAEMLRFYDRAGDSEDEGGPYPERLRRFLIEQGYIER